MAKDEGKQWLLELTQSITNQLKEDRTDIVALWEAVNEGKGMHASCREQILVKLSELDKALLEKATDLDKKLLEKAADLDKRLSITIIEVGASVGGLCILAEYLFNHLLGK